ncbi:MAG: zinc ABC transporter substrate-binding protein [Oscillospiraceae bacterium]|nr:zinc ABC transporter substrate-binding protein [Oscillospiraceae bacterium]
MKRIYSIIAAVLLLFSLVGCTSTEPQAQVAATTLPVYEFTSRLCSGTGISVTRLVTENVSCLHDYSLSVRQVKAVESAQTVVISGGGLEDFMEDVLISADKVIESAQNIPLLDCADGHEHDHGHNHEHDPHLWLSPEYAKLMARNICAGLKAQYPQYDTVFDTNLSALLSELDALLAYGRQQLQALSCQELITFHDGFAYFADAFDLTILEAVEEESGSEASAAELRHLITLVRAHNLPAIFTERSGSVSAAGVIARETGAHIYALDMAMSGSSYFEAMYHNIDTVKEALG